MKKYFCLIIPALFAGSILSAQDQPPDSLGLPGDNLNLYAVMDLFQRSETIEGFEKSLNDENSTINNLDLDGDEQVDYIRVFDDVDGDVHFIVMQVALNENENQDVAVFSVQRDDNDNVQIQLTGDEALYGKDYIIEPDMDAGADRQTPNPGYTGEKTVIRDVAPAGARTTTVQVATWPVVRYIFLPSYVAWRSPWYYGYYPTYWHPWRPYYWHYYYGYHDHLNHYYHTWYRPVSYHLTLQWNNYYRPRRSVSVMVSTRVRDGAYRMTYSKPAQRAQGEARYNRMNHAQQRNVQGTRTRSDNSLRSSPAGTKSSGRQNNAATGRSPAPAANKSINDRNRSRSDNKSTVQRPSSGKSGQPGRRPSTGKGVSKTKANRQTSASGAGKSSRSGGNPKKAGSSGKSTERRR